MKLRTGLKSLIGISVLGIGVAIFLIYTCPFAGQIAFSTLVRQVPMEHSAMAEEHSQPRDAEAQKPHAVAGKHEEAKEGGQEGVKGHPEAAQKLHEAMAEKHNEGEGLKVHLMVIPNVRSYAVKETKLFDIEVSPLGVIVLLVLIGLCLQILRQRPLNLFGYAVTAKAMGVTIFLITMWNLVFAAFLLGMEVVYLKELWLTWLTFDATVVASVIVVVLSFSKQVVPLRLKGFENLDEWIPKEGTSWRTRPGFFSLSYCYSLS